jgi:hypothetical protein
MTRTCYDAIASKAAGIPTSAEMVAGYIDGPYAWGPAQWSLFPTAVTVRIATRAETNAGQVLDVETGDATPAQAPGWCQMRRSAGQMPSVYCNRSTWPAVSAAFGAAKVAPPNWWIAAYDGVAQIPAGAIAKQYTDNPPSNPYDTSVVADLWPGVDERSQSMFIMTTTGQPAVLVANGVAVGLPTAEDAANLNAGGVPTIPLSAGLFTSIYQASNPQLKLPLAAPSFSLTGALTPVAPS